MRVLIQCNTCKATYWVRGTSERPNSYQMHEDADLSECCEHIQADPYDCLPINCSVDDEF